VSAQGISIALSATLWAYVGGGAAMAGYLAWIALRTSETVMRTKAPGAARLAYERGMTIKAFVIKIGAPAAFLFWPVIVFMLAKGDSE
jgi:threonine/homoserine/homoserine lactone efflux protein